MMDRILVVQDRMRQKLATKYGKIEVLQNQWDKIFGQIQRTATRKNDDEGDKFCMQVCRIRKYVIEYLLKRYVEKCQELHHIAFM